MPVFVVIAIRQREEISGKLLAAFKEGDWFQITDDAWLVDYDGIARQLSEKLDLSNRENVNVGPTGIVFPITNYFGLAPPDTWEWLGAHVSRREG